MTQKVITRFAPSPTGLLHAGNYRTAIFAYLYARKKGGKFLLRIEDTDQARSKKEFEDNIVETLSWLGLAHDGFFRQSDHRSRHTTELQRLLDADKAYISKETPKEEGERAEVIRFRNPNTKISFDDALRGEISFDTTELGDFVIARSMTEPLFHFAVVVDDNDEGVTFVIRGEDHISNTPRQILISQALGYPVPTYIHMPLVLSADKTKLSKRRGAKALTQYRGEGILPEAMLNCLSLIGWHPEGEREIFTKEELVEVFDFSRLQKSSGIFDEKKLLWFNHEHLKKLSDAEYAARLKEFVGKDIDPRLVPLLKERAKTFKEAAEMLETEFGFFGKITYEPKLLLQNGKIGAGVASNHLKAVAELLQHVPDEGFTALQLKDIIWPYADAQGRGAVLWPLRVALSGREKSPDPFTICGLLGKQVTLERIAEAVQKL